MCLAEGLQCSDAGEARTRSLLVSSQALYHWATAFPAQLLKYWLNNNFSARELKRLKYLELFKICVHS